MEKKQLEPLEPITWQSRRGLSNKPMILEIKELDEVNKILDGDMYRLERFSESKGAYILVKRSR